jgi:spore coat protein U-like protein
VRWIRVFLTIVFLVFAGEVWGQSCGVTVLSVSFGGYDGFLVSPLDATGDINITCDTGTAFTVRLDPGRNSGGSFDPRKMQLVGGGATLNYNFYRDSPRIEVWGDGTNNTYVQQGVATGGVDHFTVYGRAPGGQNIVVGLYTDAVTVTVEW